jgi:hypothetical protein
MQAEKVKTNFSEMAFKTLSQTIDCVNPRLLVDQRAQDCKKRKIEGVINELHDKN